jgi:Spy/CpxP family protein refolding chaperone
MGTTRVKRGSTSFFCVALLLGSQVTAGQGLAAPLPAPGPWMGQGPMGMQPSDQRFIVMMIPHHEGAIAMAELALTRSKRPEIRALAERIRSSQAAENAQMRSWYSWAPMDWWGRGVGAGGGNGDGARLGDGRRHARDDNQPGRAQNGHRF